MDFPLKEIQNLQGFIKVLSKYFFNKPGFLELREIIPYMKVALKYQVQKITITDAKAFKRVKKAHNS